MASGVRASARSPVITSYSTKYSTLPSRRPPPSPAYPSSYKSSYGSIGAGSPVGMGTYEPSTYKYRTRNVSRDRLSSAGSNYNGISSTTSVPKYRGRSPSPSRRVTSPGITTMPRPLPPSKYDTYGRRVDRVDRVDITNNVNTLRNNLHRTDDPSRTRGPVKPDYSTSSLNSKGRYTPSDYTDDVITGRLSRAKRTNSVSDITNGLDNVSLGKSKRFGSTYDISPSKALSNGNSRAEVEELFGVGTSTPRKHKTHVETMHVNGDDDKYATHRENSPKLPDISVSNKTSRSPSLDRSTSSDRDDLDTQTRKRKVGGKPASRHNSNSSISSLHNGVLNNKDVNNNHGVVGLRNLGNTCFMNSVLQCLSNTRVLAEYCQTDDHLNDINRKTSNMKGSLVKAYADVMHKMWSSSTDSAVGPTEFKSQIAKFAKRFVGYNQQDAQEFLIYLLEGLHEDLNRVQEKKKRFIDDSNEMETISASMKSSMCWKRYLEHDNSKVVDTFVGQLRSTLTCTDCHYVSNTFDPFWDLSLPLKKGRSRDTTLANCLDLFTQEEVLDGDEKPFCARCKKRQKCTKRFYIQKFPKVLIVHLKRFNHESLYRSKLSQMVDFPLKGLDLSPFCAETTSAVAPSYNLYAVVNHSGTPMGGHYTAYCKHPYSQQWHYFSDARVSSISESRVVSPEAYVLFYELANGVSRL